MLTFRPTALRSITTTGIWVLGLFALFVCLYHPISGGVGGLFALLFGTFFPSIANLLVSWCLAFKVLHLRKIASACLFILISFMLGVNFRMVDLRPGSYINVSNITEIQPSEGCMCWYFSPSGMRADQISFSTFVYYSFLAFRDDNFWTWLLKNIKSGPYYNNFGFSRSNETAIGYSP